MCSDRYVSPSPRAPQLVAPLLVALLLTAGCGRKEPPTAPPNMAPAKTSSLAIEQRGYQLYLSFDYPTTTVSGLALEGLESIEIYHLTRPLAEILAPPEELSDGMEEADPDAVDGEIAAPDESVDPALDTGLLDELSAAEGAEDLDLDMDLDVGIPEIEGEEVADDLGEEAEGDAELDPLAPIVEEEAIDPLAISGREFAASALLERTLDPEAIQAALIGDRIAVTLPLPQPLPEEPEVHSFGIVMYSSKRESPRSNVVSLLPAVPPPPPENLTAEAGPLGVSLAWEISPEVKIKSFHVFRRPAQIRFYGAPLATVSSLSRTYLDTSAIFGERYIYTVSSVASTAPTIESGTGAEREVDYQDRFAPVPPKRLVALGEARRVRLLWEASPGVDVAGYIVYRALEGAEPEALFTAPIVDPEYSDTTAVPGRTYSYTVRAVDLTGNLGEPSEAATTRAR